jgi:hypothetical protein
MDFWIGLISGCLSGASLGLILSNFVKNQREDVKILRQALKDMEEYHKATIARLRGRIKEYEQPTELQQIAQIENIDDIIAVLSQNLAGIKGIPRWLRPFLPAIQEYIKQNPEKVKEVIEKFMRSGGKKGVEEAGGYEIA